MERKLLKGLLSHRSFEAQKGYVYPELFSGDHRLIFKTIAEAHEQYKCDLSTDEVYALLTSKRTLSTTAKDSIKELLQEIDREIAPNEKLSTDLLSNVHRKNVAKQIAELAVDIMDKGEGDFSTIQKLSEEALTSSVTDPLRTISTDIPTLLEQTKNQGKWKWRMPSVADKVPNIGPGNNVIIFGRPEVGKSSYVAYEVIGWLKQGAKVHYFANEEPGIKIMLNFIRSALGLSDKELMAQHGTAYADWDNIKARLSLFDETDMGVEDIDAHLSGCSESERPDIIVIDQTDKISCASKFDSGHERLKDLYVKVRQLARRNNVVAVNVSQASADAEGHRAITFSMMDMSKTGKAGEADVIIGVGKDPIVDENLQRYLTVSKNKLPGGGWKGTIPCLFNPTTCTWVAEGV